MITTLLFDLGGTLHTVRRTPETRLRFCSHVIRLLNEHGIPTTLSPEDLDAMLAVNGETYKHFGEEHLIELPQSVIWSQYYLKELHIDPEKLAPFAEELSFYYDQERMENVPRPFLKETMAELHQMGIRLGIISNIISTTLVPYALKQYGIDQYMECVVMSSAVGIRKPDPRIFLLGVEALGLKPEEVMVVGDSLDKDIIPAREAGCHAVWLRGEGWTPYNGDCPACETIDSLDELLKIIEKKYTT